MTTEDLRSRLLLMRAMQVRSYIAEEEAHVNICLDYHSKTPHTDAPEPASLLGRRLTVPVTLHLLPSLQVSSMYIEINLCMWAR